MGGGVAFEIGGVGSVRNSESWRGIGGGGGEGGGCKLLEGGQQRASNFEIRTCGK